MKISKIGSSPKQMAYARRTWGGKGKSKKDIALDVGYSRFVANSVKSKIENHKGFNNAMSQLALESNNVALSVLHEFKARGVKGFSNKDLVGALNAIGSAWQKFNKTPEEGGDTKKSKNKLRNVILQRVEHQHVTAQPIGTLPPVETIEDAMEEAEAVAEEEGVEGGNDPGF